ncbi:GNAT family N-acetyltransferase [Methanimicrococcus stummii]|nr:GNAT family N-acetyltransferase [Methanimicrococcus sp. Es2]
MTFKIKKLETTRELEDVAALASEIWTEHYTPLIGAAQTAYMIDVFQSAERIKKDIADQNYNYFAAYDDALPGRQIGYFALRPDEKGVFVSKIYVLKEYRQKGIATLMMNFILDFAKATVKSEKLFDTNRKQPCLWLTVNKGNLGSIEFYKKTGFTIEEEIVTDIGNGFFMDDYVMTLYFDAD